MKLTLTTKSFVLFGSGEGNVLIDVDQTFHANGFPYVPGRSLKGLLRESMQEILEMYQIAEQPILDDLFGKPDRLRSNGKLQFSNLQVLDYEDLLKELEVLRKDEPAVFHPDNIKQRYTSEIPQTAIKDGVALDKSLRNYRVLNPELIFVGDLEDAEPLTDLEKRLLKAAVQNLRVAGVRRNKGFGEIKLEIDFGKAIADQKVSPSSLDFENGMKITIETKSSVILATEGADQNTVSTEKTFPASAIRGLFAAKIITEGKLRAAHKDPNFHQLILSGDVTYGNCHLDGTTQLPANFQQQKGCPEAPIKDIFRVPKDKFRPFRGLGKMVGSELKKVTVKTHASFHNSRPDRTAGKSMDTDAAQGIFYYESIAPNQKFSGEIHGNPEALRKLYATFGNSFKGRMGKSKSAQYGKVQIKLEPIPKVEQKQIEPAASAYYLIALSPWVFLNEFGLAQANLAALSETLKQFGISSPMVSNVVARFKMVETYNSILQSKTSQCPAFDTGSVFELKLEKEDVEKLNKQLNAGFGEWTTIGYGQFKLEPKSQQLAQIPLLKEQKETVNQKGVTHPKSKFSILNVLWEDSKRNDHISKLRKSAIRAGKKKPVPNHLASRILTKLSELESISNNDEKQQKWKDWLDHIEGRQAGNTLRDTGLLDQLNKLTNIVQQSDESLQALAMSKVELGLIYWRTFFETSRKTKDETKKGNPNA